MNFNMTRKKIYFLLLGVLFLLMIVLIRSCSLGEDKLLDSNNKEEISSIIDNKEDNGDNLGDLPNDLGRFNTQDDQNIFNDLEKEHVSTSPNNNTSNKKPSNNQNEDTSNNNDSEDNNYWNILFNEVKKANSAFEYLLNLTEEALN